MVHLTPPPAKRRPGGGKHGAKKRGRIHVCDSPASTLEIEPVDSSHLSRTKSPRLSRRATKADGSASDGMAGPPLLSIAAAMATENTGFLMRRVLVEFLALSLSLPTNLTEVTLFATPAQRRFWCFRWPAWMCCSSKRPNISRQISSYHRHSSSTKVSRENAFLECLMWPVFKHRLIAVPSFESRQSTFAHTPVP